MIKLTKEQAAAVTTKAAKSLVLACPGSGKTEVIIQRILWLIAQGKDNRGRALCASDIAVITYTNAAARVVERRLADLGIDGELGFVGTLHSFCVRHLTRFGPWPDLRVMDDEDADELLARCAKDLVLETSWKQLTDCRKNWAEEVLLPETPTRIAVAHYHAAMGSRGEVDYDTLLTWTLKTLRAPHMKRRSWAHLIVDEFQDVARIDAEIYAAAAADNRFYVADPMQSIFAFRGGSVAEVEALAADPRWEKHQLTVNFRSLPRICEALNNLSRWGAPGSMRPTTSFAADGGDVRLRYFDDETEEAEGIATGIQHRVEEVGPPLDPDHKGFEGRTRAFVAAASQIAVLARNNRIADKIAEVMRQRGVPVCQLKPVDPPKDWKLALAALGVLARRRSTAAARRYIERSSAFWAKPIPPELTGYANKMDVELAALGASDASRALILKRFAELPTSADLRDLELSLTLEPINRRMEGEGCFVGTIHGAKGNEWDRVVIAGFEAETIPGTRKGTDIAEERRLAYVGISRARLSVTLTWACYRQRFGGGRMQGGFVSPFAEEAGIR